MKINDSEYLLSQYADDSCLLLIENVQSSEKFSECAGLRAYFDKTEAIWIGSKIHSKDKLNLNWNYSGKFKLLGIKFDLFSENKTLVNFVEKIKKNTELT